MRRRFGFLQGLRARIAMALLGALLLQFVGGEIIFARVEDARMERGRSQRLADWLLFADEFIDARPDAVARMNDMWHPRLRITRHDAPPAVGGGAVSADREIARRVIAAQPRVAPPGLPSRRDGDAPPGTVRPSQGGWLCFRSVKYFQG